MGRFPLVLGVLILLVAHSSIAQQNTQQPPTFKGGVELVTVDAIVVDKDGHPVKGLTPDDFIVTLQGQVRPVRLLDYREYGAAPPTAPPPTANTTNPPEAGVRQNRGGRIVVIVFDDLSYKPGPGKTLLAAAARTLASFDADDLIGITTTSGLGPVVNPTRDRQALLAALHNKTMVGRYDDSSAPFEITEEEALQIQRDFPQDTLPKVVARECGAISGGRFDDKPPDTPCGSAVRGAADALGEMTLRRMKDQLTVYREIIGQLSNAPDTPRVIIALTRGIALGLDTSEYADSLAQLSRTAADSKVQFYALSELPDMVDFSSHLKAPELLEAGKFMNSGAQVVANAAGGEAFLVVGTADRFIKRIEAETSGIYRLGVEPPAGAGSARYLKTSIKVRRPGLTVRASPESVIPSTAAAPATPDAGLRTRLAEGGASFGVPLTAGAEMRRDPTDASRVEMDVTVEVPSTVKGPVTMMYGLVDDHGQITHAGRAEAAQTARSDYQLAFPVRVTAGHYRLRLVASDANGDIGSVEKPVSVALTRIGGYTVSDLLTSLPGPDAASKLVAPDAIPPDARTLTVQLEVYPDRSGGGDDPLQVRFELLAADQSVPIATSETPASVSGTVRAAAATLPIASLPSGPYTIRATVFAKGAAVGSESIAVRKGG